SETAEQLAVADASIARLEGRRAVELATALDGARADLERALAESARLNTELHDTDRRKNEFLAMLGHELRNPLAAISAAVQIMRISGHDPEQIDRARGITERQTQQLTRLVDDLLDVARVTRGKVSLQLERVDVAEIVRRAIDVVTPSLAEKSHRFELHVGTPISAMADPARLEQMVSNLLTNAAKYTDAGGQIHLVLERDGDASEPGHAVIRVRDSGIGIAAEMLPRIFDPFLQIAPTLHRSGGGLGIGLTLVNHLVHLHGGTISVTSELGKGSEFVVRLPALPAAPKAARVVHPPAVRPTHPRQRVLVVDDNTDSADMMAELLTVWGHDTQQAHDGLDAIKVATEFGPTIVLLDIGLPGIDGYEVARRLRAMPQTQDAMIIAVSGYGLAVDRARSTSAGFNLHLVKPVDIVALRRVLSTGTIPVPALATVG
ncbi:MAG: response regulator, partial [Deltaproteobacteria bacterium]|nr:response regulator [Deltaproteobacteria bacterium]